MVAQNRTIAGRVTNSEGNPVPFATVVVKGTNTAASADENGNFSIQAASNAILVVSAASFQDNEINIGTKQQH